MRSRLAETRIQQLVKCILCALILGTGLFDVQRVQAAGNTGAALTAAQPATLELRREALVVGGDVTLGDVLLFGADARDLREVLASEPVRAAGVPIGSFTLTHQHVEQRLRELGVNLAQVLLSGAVSCRVTRQELDPEEKSPRIVAVRHEGSAPLDRISGNEVNTSTSEAKLHTLADLLLDRVRQDAADLGGTPEVEFGRTAEPFLNLTTPPWEFSIQSHDRHKLGLRDFRVVIRRDGRPQRTVPLFVHVRLSKRVLVSAKPLGIGTYVRRDALTTETRVFDNERLIGLDGLEQAVGQQVRKFVPQGEMLKHDDLKPVDLVKRSRPVTLIHADENTRLRLTGVALDSGGFGDEVRVRIGDTRKERRELQGVVTGLGTVRLVEEGW